MMRVSNCYIFFLVCLFACQELKEPYGVDTNNDSPKEKIKRPVIFYSGKPEIPRTDFEITTAGIGKLLVGSSLEKVKEHYDSLKPISVFERGIEWSGAKVLFPNGKWIIAESVYTVDAITQIKTNNPEYKTKEGYHAGMPVDSIFILGDSVRADYEHRLFEFGNSNIWFKIDPLKEKKYFKNKAAHSSILKNSYIEQIFIICEDC